MSSVGDVYPLTDRNSAQEKKGNINYKDTKYICISNGFCSLLERSVYIFIPDGHISECLPFCSLIIFSIPWELCL